MSIEDAAFAAVLYWARDDAITAVAIAGAESSYRNDAPSSTDVWGMPGEQLWWRPYSCDHVYSWGLWQIFMPAHHDKLEAATGSTDPCYWRDRLCNPFTNAAIAHLIWQMSGWYPWSTYNNLAYGAFLAQAEVAVDAALGVLPPVVVPLPPAVAPPWQAVAPPATAVPPPPSL